MCGATDCWSCGPAQGYKVARVWNARAGRYVSRNPDDEEPSEDAMEAVRFRRDVQADPGTEAVIARGVDAQQAAGEADLRAKARDIIAASCLRPGATGYAYTEFCSEFGAVLPTRYAEILRASNDPVWVETLAAVTLKAQQDAITARDDRRQRIEEGSA
jgi:hypothetical protein